MGQSVSRHRSSRPPQPVCEDNTPAEPGSSRPSPAGSRTASTSASKRSRRSSLRRSLLSFVPRSDSSSSVRSAAPSSSTEGSPTPRKRWRSSFARRSSKPSSLPPQLAELRREEVQGGSTAIEVGTSQMGEQSTPGTHAHPPIPDIVISGEASPEAEPCAEPEEQQPVNAETQEWLGDPPRDVVSSSDPIAQTASAAAQEPPSVSSEQVTSTEEVPTLPAESAAPLPAATEPNSDTPPEAETLPQAPRQFPPPGTLVVVQGVVNTTDVPSSDNTTSSRRPSRSTTPRPPSAAAGRQGEPALNSRDGERHGARNRLSSFINRTRPSDGRPADSGSSNRNSAVSDLSSSTASHDAASAEEASIADDQESIHDDHDARPRPLSQGSIDVLGTLLRCAL